MQAQIREFFFTTRYRHVSLDCIVSRETKVFGKKIAARRGELFKTQSQIGALVGMSDENLGRIERSEVAGMLTKNIPALARALGVDEDTFRKQFIAGDGDKSKSKTDRPSSATMTYNPSQGEAVNVEEMDAYDLVVLTRRAVKELLKRQKKHPTMMGAKDQLQTTEAFLDAFADDLIRRRAKHA